MKTSTRSKLLKVVSATAATAMLAACGGAASSAPASTAASTSSTSAAAPAAAGNVTINVWHSMEGNNGAAFEAMVDNFNATAGKEKGITANSVFQGRDTAVKLKTLIQASDTANMPEVCLVYGASLPVVAEYAGTVPVDTMYGTGSMSVKKEDIVPATVQTYTYKDVQVCMPFNSSTLLLWYNVDAFNEAGLDPASPPRTLDEMADACAKLTIKDGSGNITRYGFNTQLDRYQMVNLVGNQGEGTYFGDNEGGRQGLITKVTCEEQMLNVYKGWEKIVATGGVKYTYDNQNEEFATGVNAMTMMSSARITSVTNLSKDSGVNWAVTNLPSITSSDKGGACIGGASLAMFDNGSDEKKAAAWEFMQYAVSPETQATWSMATGYLPVNLATKNEANFAEHLANSAALQVALAQFESSNPKVQEPVMMMGGSVDELIMEASANIAEGTMTAEEATRYVVDEVNLLFTDYNRANG